MSTRSHLNRAMRITALTVLILFAACANTPGVGSVAPTTRLTTPTTLLVENNNWMDAVVYMTTTGSATRQRLGRIDGLSTARLRIPRSFQHRGVLLAIRLAGSRTSYVTEQMYVDPGRDFHLRIANQQSHTTLIER